MKAHRYALGRRCQSHDFGLFLFAAAAFVLEDYRKFALAQEQNNRDNGETRSQDHTFNSHTPDDEEPALFSQTNTVKAIPSPPMSPTFSLASVSGPEMIATVYKGTVDDKVGLAMKHGSSGMTGKEDCAQLSVSVGSARAEHDCVDCKWSSCNQC